VSPVCDMGPIDFVRSQARTCHTRTLPFGLPQRVEDLGQASIKVCPNRVASSQGVDNRPGRAAGPSLSFPNG
jgi:hypothetical protein